MQGEILTAVHDDLDDLGAGAREGVPQRRSEIRDGRHPLVLQTVGTRDRRQVEIVAPEPAPNFDKIKVGDPVVATYYESVALAIAPVEDAKPGISGTAALATAAPGETPGGAMAEQIELRAVVKAVDPKTRSVTLDVPEGGERTLKAGEAIDLEKVKVGEQVSVTLTRALAISIMKH